MSPSDLYWTGEWTRCLYDTHVVEGNVEQLLIKPIVDLTIDFKEEIIAGNFNRKLQQFYGKLNSNFNHEKPKSKPINPILVVLARDFASAI